MHILFVCGQDRKTAVFRDQIQPLLEQLLTARSVYRNTRIGILFPGEKNLVQIEKNGLILFQISSVGNDTQFPKLTPGTLKDINGFFSEFDPDIVHSFDEGFIGLVTQFVSVSKKIPYVLTLLPQNHEQKVSLASKIILGFTGQVGITDEFVGNFYNNSIAVIGTPSQISVLEKDYDFHGYTVNPEELLHQKNLLSFYKRMHARSQQSSKEHRYQSLLNFIPIKSLQDKLKAKLPEKDVKKNTRKVGASSAVITGIAVLGSLLTFTAIKGFSKLKHKKTEK